MLGSVLCAGYIMVGGKIPKTRRMGFCLREMNIIVKEVEINQISI